MTATELKSKPVKVVVVPRNSPIDKLIAYKRVQLDLNGQFHLRLAFCDKNEPTIADFELWEGMCTEGGSPGHYIDIGTKKYHEIAGSASAVEAMASNTQNGVVWNRLCALATLNNATGCLKNRPYSIAKLIRDAYDAMASRSLSQSLVFDHGMAVVDAFFYPQNKRDWKTLFSDAQYVAVRKLWEGFDVKECDVLEFTLPLYLRQLFLSGCSIAEIIERVSWWINAHNRVQDFKERASAKKYTVRLFKCAGGEKAAGLVHAADVFESEAFVYQYVGSGNLALGIIRSHRGHVHIQPSVRHPGLDLKDLFDELNRLEPGVWYFEERFGSGKTQILMNGSRQYTGVTPTSFSDDQIIQLAEHFVTFKRK